MSLRRRQTIRTAARFRQAPRPYVLNPPLTTRQNFSPGENLDFELVLLGPALEALPYFFHIFGEVGRRGLGRERGRYEVVGVEQVEGEGRWLVYEGGEGRLAGVRAARGPVMEFADVEVSSVSLRFLTPLRLKSNGRLVTRLSFAEFFERLAERLTLLAAFYGDGRGVELSGLAERAGRVEVERDGLRWYDWGRYSRRQEAHMKLGGLKGTITWRGDLGPYLPYLHLGAVVNAGQGTTFGLGRYEMRF